MQDKELYQHLLGLTAPWTVSEVKLDMQSQEIHVKVEHPRGTKFCCPDCQKQLPCYDHGEERQWRERIHVWYLLVDSFAHLSKSLHGSSERLDQYFM
jgi:hypothetical protein